jgi:hypothetical protein
VSTALCPNCGTPRVGAFRFCRSCQLDFDAVTDAAPAAGPAIAPPASPVAVATPPFAASAAAPPLSPPSVSETSQGSESATGTTSQATGTTSQATGTTSQATGTTSQATGASAGRSGIRSLALGVGILVVFGVLAVGVVLTGGLKSGPNRADFATAANDFRATIAAPSAATTFEDRKAYWAAVATASDRLATKLRAMSFRYPTSTDVAKLIAGLVILQERATAASGLTSVGALLAAESTTTQATTNVSDLAARVANDLGLTNTPPAP